MGHIAVLGVFAADTTYRADRAPRMGETILGNSFTLGPGGKGSNQSVAAARSGGDVYFITRLGQDAFAGLAFDTWKEAGVKAQARQMPDAHTGAAYIFIEEASGDNAIIICPGAAGQICKDDVEDNRAIIEAAAVFMTQLEQPIEAAEAGLAMAKAAGAITILNPAPAAELPAAIYPMCDYITPNESEAEGLTGIRVTDRASATAAGLKLMEMGAGAALLTLGADGALLVTPNGAEHIPAFAAGDVAETTGAGDALNGGFAVGLAEGMAPLEAARFGCAVAGISVTRPGAAASMPSREDVEALLKR